VDDLSEADVPAAIGVLRESFFDYPVMRYVIGDAGREYGERLDAMLNFFALARIHRAEHLFGIRSDAGDLVAAGLVSIPGIGTSPEEVLRLRADLWNRLGSAAERRYAAYSSTCQQFAMNEPHLHVNVIGVARKYQGTGLGRALLEHVHSLSASNPESIGVTLTTENPDNVAFYRKFGYSLTGHARVSPELETWAFFRPN
jgi:ribosomal protein S18 acetylase RimI-like enzyme